MVGRVRARERRSARLGTMVVLTGGGQDSDCAAADQRSPVPSSYRFLIWHDSGFSHTDWDTPLHPRIPGAGNIHMYISLVFNLDT